MSTTPVAKTTPRKPAKPPVHRRAANDKSSLDPRHEARLIAELNYFMRGAL